MPMTVTKVWAAPGVLWPATRIPETKDRTVMLLTASAGASSAKVSCVTPALANPRATLPRLAQADHGRGKAQLRVIRVTGRETDYVQRGDGAGHAAICIADNHAEGGRVVHGRLGDGQGGLGGAADGQPVFEPLVGGRRAVSANAELRLGARRLRHADRLIRDERIDDRELRRSAGQSPRAVADNQGVLACIAAQDVADGQVRRAGAGDIPAVSRVLPVPFCTH